MINPRNLRLIIAVIGLVGIFAFFASSQHSLVDRTALQVNKPAADSPHVPPPAAAAAPVSPPPPSQQQKQQEGSQKQLNDENSDKKIRYKELLILVLSHHTKRLMVNQTKSWPIS